MAPSKRLKGPTWPLRLILNGREVQTRVVPTATALDFLRLNMRLTGTKGACLEGECGSCTILVDERPVNACLMLAPQLEGRRVETVESLAPPKILHVLQQGFLESGAVQCGYCTPGFLMAAKALLAVNRSPTRADVAEALEGNLCRCTGYTNIVKAVLQAASLMRGRTDG